MRHAIAIIVTAALTMPGAFAQLPPPPPMPVIPPPPMTVPAPVPPANPVPPPLPSGYGTPPGINTTAPLTSTPHVIYRALDYRAPKKRRWKRRHRPS